MSQHPMYSMLGIGFSILVVVLVAVFFVISRSDRKAAAKAHGHLVARRRKRRRGRGRLPASDSPRHRRGGRCCRAGRPEEAGASGRLGPAGSAARDRTGRWEQLASGTGNIKVKALPVVCR